MSTFIVPRTCTQAAEATGQEPPGSRLLAKFRRSDAYVLLGDPGSGKTTSFYREAEAEGGQYVTARDLITFEDRPEWHDHTLFIDGLDEVRAGQSDGRTPLDAIRRKLNQLGRPRFRLSCREADWLGAGDQDALKRVAPGGRVAALHLDPLDEEAVEAILRHHPSMPDAAGFLRAAKDRGLDALLRNPQTLNLLVEAVRGDAWPATRQETYDLACRRLVMEHNREHMSVARATPIRVDSLLDTAGFLCAVQLIAGQTGFSLNSTEAAPGYLVPEDLRDAPPSCEAVLKTKLFAARGGAERLEPVHRSVAEYLAARHLAAKAKSQGFPMGRVLALITGTDGAPVAALRGLFAWLAVFSPQDREALIERDPLGVVLYGDVSAFTPQEKTRMLDSLRREAERYPWFRSADWTASPFGALATPDMEAEFRRILTSSDREPAHQALAGCVLDALEHGQGLPQLVPVLFALVRDPGWQLGVRRTALEVLLADKRTDPDRRERLLELLEDVHSARVRDPGYRLLDRLLSALYPDLVPPERVFDYFHLTPRRSPNLPWFWRYKLLKHSNDEQSVVLLDELARRPEVCSALHKDFRLTTVPGELLLRCLEAHGDEVTHQRLHDWLGTGLDEHGWPDAGGDAAEGIRVWLERRPDRYKGVLALGLSCCANQAEWARCTSKTEARLYHAPVPAVLGRWFLDRALEQKKPERAKYLFAKAVRTLWSGRDNQGLSIDALVAWTESHPRFKPQLDRLLVCDISDRDQEHRRHRRQRLIEEREGKAKWVDWVRAHIDDIQQGRTNPANLHTLGLAYFDILVGVKGQSPHERLADLLDGQPDLVDAALSGFRKSLERDDLPAVEEIADLAARGQQHYILLPFLAGMEERFHGDPAGVLALDDDRIRRALAFHYAYGTGEHPTWMTPLLERRASLVAEVMLAYAVPALRHGKTHVADVYALAFDESFASVARHASLPLLRVFPVNARTTQVLHVLGDLLKSGLRHLGRTMLLPVVAEKLRRRSMGTTQRVYWLAAGLVADPSGYEGILEAFVCGRQGRIRALAGFLSDRADQGRLGADLPVSTLALLVELLGSQFFPYRLEGSGSVTPEMEAADLISNLITRMERYPGEIATAALERLVTLPALDRWQDSLRGALYRQQAARREAQFSHPSPRQVNEVLLNRQPANATDLAALTLWHLRDLARQIRDGATDDYKQYWNVDRYGRPVAPKPENDCRNALLSDLRTRLARADVDAQPEGQYADDKRADIRVSFGGSAGFNTPVEIKRNCHADLWRAMRAQLMEQYARDPGAQGHGIYLVFWFGPEGTPPPPPPQAGKPVGPADMEARLRDMLGPEERRRISICVVDCAVSSRPRA